MRLKIRKLCWLPLLAAGEAAALGLGEATVQSSLGERFRAEVQLLERVGDEPARPDCFRLVLPENQDLPTLGKATFTVERRGAEKRLLIVSPQSILEPVLQLDLRVGCGAEITRRYSLLIDPALVPSHRAVADKPARAPAAATAAATSPSGGTHWSTGEGESLRSIAAAMLPGQPGAQQHFMHAVRSANPDLDFGVQGRRVLSPGTQFSVPAIRPAVPAFPGSNTPAARPGTKSASSSALPSPSPAAKINAPRVTSSAARSGDRLMLSDTLDEPRVVTDELRLRLATDLSGSTGSADGIASESQRALLRVEYQLLASLNAQANQQLSLAEQIRLLEASLASLQTTEAGITRDSVTASVPQITLPVAAEERPLPPPVAPKVEKRAVPETLSSFSTLDWLILLAGTIGVVGLLVWFMQRRSRPAAPESVVAVGYPAPAPSAPDVFSSHSVVDINLSDPLIPTQGDAVVPAGSDNAPIHPSRAPLSSFSQEIAETDETPEFNPVMELAEVMLSFGRVKGATQALQEYIELNPAESLQPWMKLLEIYRQNDMRDDFELYSEKLPMTFNVARIDWDSPLLLQQNPAVEPGDEGAALEDLFKRLPHLAALPHIVERITRSWGSDECAVYLSSLLRDNRNGERAGFSLEVVRELLFLSNFVEKHLKTPA